MSHIFMILVGYKANIFNLYTWMKNVVNLMPVFKLELTITYQITKAYNEWQVILY